jgi:hypothetical protein
MDIWAMLAVGAAALVLSFLTEAGKDGWKLARRFVARKRAERRAKSATSTPLIEDKKANETKS